MSFCTLILYQLSNDDNYYFPFPGTGKGNYHFLYSDFSISHFIPALKKLSGKIGTYGFALILGLWLFSTCSISGQCDIFTGSVSITTPITCYGGNAVITMTASGGYTPYTFTFGTFPPVISSNNSRTFEVPAGTGYTWSITSDGCATISGTLDINQPAELNASASATSPSCYNSSTGAATISADEGTPPYLFSADGINYDTSPLLTGLPAGNLTLFIMDSNNCISTVTVEIASLPPLNPGAHTIIPITVCQNYNPDVLIFTTPPTGGIPPYSYQWYLNGNPVAGASSSSYDPPNLISSGTYVYYCTVTDGCGQSENTSVKTITVVDEATITISGGGTYCQNDFVTLTSGVTGGTGTILYQWQESPDNTTWTSISGATGSDFNPPTNSAGIIYYRVDLIVNGAACNDPLSNSGAVIVNPLPVTSAIYHY